MKNKIFTSAIFSLAIVLSISLLSFQTGKIFNIKTLDEPIAYRYDSVIVTSNYKFENAAPAATHAFVRVVYPSFQNNELNYTIKKAILSPVTVKYKFKNEFAAEHPALSNMKAINNPAAGYQEFGDNFLKDFERQAPQESLKAYWYADINTKVLANETYYVAILCKKDYFTGGAHDLYDNLYLNYNTENRRLFNWESQFKPGMVNQVKVIAETIFRKNEGLAPAQKLEGYFFENEKFSLPANFTITAKGLIFYYGYYEIKPFAAGTTELAIPFEKLKGLVLPNSILANQMHSH